MDRGEIEALGPGAYARRFTRLKRARTAAAVVVGFDTEYDSRTSALLSVQLSHGGSTLFWPTRRLDPATLMARVDALLGCPVLKIELATYWSLAELQHLPVWIDGWSYREFSGSFECNFTARSRTLSIYDVARWYPGAGLAAAARTIGQEKKTWARELVTTADVLEPAFREYAVHDAVLAESLLVRLRERWLADGIDILVYRTPAGASAAALRRSLTADVEPPPSRARHVALLGCWGGRAEAFARGSFPAVYEYDLASAYPRALMALGRVPRGTDWRCAVSWRVVGRADGYATITFDHPRAIAVPVLPVFHDGMLLYPRVGRTTCTLAECRAARRLGCKVELIEAWYYTDGCSELPDWIGGLLARREAATDPLSSYVLKLQANAIIGKLAQRHRDASLEALRRASIELDIPFKLLVCLPEQERRLLGVCEPDRPGGSWWPEVNGLVTGLVRARIGELAATHAPVYCATDSIWTQAPIATLPPDLALKRAGPGQVWRTRLARIGTDHVVHHGWHSRAAAAAAMEGKGLSYTTRRPVRARESIRRGLPLGRFLDAPRTGTLDWCHKRELLPDGSSRAWESVEAYDRGRPKRK